MVIPVLGKAQITAFITVIKIERHGKLPVAQRFGRVIAMRPKKTSVFRVITTNPEFFKSPLFVECVNAFNFRRNTRH